MSLKVEISVLLSVMSDVHIYKNCQMMFIICVPIPVYNLETIILLLLSFSFCLISDQTQECVIAFSKVSSFAMLTRWPEFVSCTFSIFWFLLSSIPYMTHFLSAAKIM